MTTSHLQETMDVKLSPPTPPRLLESAITDSEKIDISDKNYQF